MGQSPPSTASPHRVDLHAHYVGRDLIDTAKADGPRFGLGIEETPLGEQVCFPDGSKVRPFFRELWDLDARLAAMDSSGVALQAISTWTDILGDGVLSGAEAAAWARLQNESLAAAARQHPTRLAAMGVLPMQDARSALAELEYCTAALGMRSMEIGTSIGEWNLDDERLDPIWARLAEDRVLVFLHPPRRTAAASRLGRYFLNNLIGNPLESVLAASSLVFGGVVDRHPDLEVCLPHAGGYFPYQVGRLDRGFVAKPECREHVQRPPSEYLRRFWYDTLSFRPDTLRFLGELVGIDRLVFGTDYPFPMGDPNAVQVVEAALPDADLRGVWGETARALLGAPARAATGRGAQ